MSVLESIKIKMSEAYFARLREPAGTGADERLNVRVRVMVTPSELAAIDAWREQQNAHGWPVASRSEAIRQLLWWGRVGHDTMVNYLPDPEQPDQAEG